ncbi:MAG: aldo/keto reductase, partial [Beijerinckiaceae bacterium]|nr:aldo/keto reductase [Beijerinckiaceae bacterium]
MQQRKLGRSGLSFAPLVLGGHVFGWTIDEATSHSILDAFIDHGFALIDTADTYSTWVPGHQGGESETIIGNWLQAARKRDRVLLATKAGGDMTNVGKGLSKAHILRSAEDSLRRLKTDRIDLYQAHFDDTSVALEETLEA